MGNDGNLQSIRDRIADSVKGVGAVEVVGLDMEDDREPVFDAAVERACNILGRVDAFVNCYTYEGKFRCFYWQFLDVVVSKLSAKIRFVVMRQMKKYMKETIITGRLL